MNKLPLWVCIIFTLCITPSLAQKLPSQNKVTNTLVELVHQKKWIHGSADCSKNTDPAIDILALNAHTFILRQNKCLHYEAPFIYVLFGSEKVFIQDTGATENPEQFPLYDTINTLVTAYENKHGLKDLHWIVSHSHSHSDHIGGDNQFKHRKNITLIAPKSDAMHTFFGFNDWPNTSKTFSLGQRILTILPLPGHQQESIAVHDNQTNIILTGDSFYPGRLYIKNWSIYKKSIRTLLSFAQSKNVSTFLGTHIEMSNIAGEDYQIGSTYQPNEHSLVLTLDDLKTLNQQLKSMGNKAEKAILNSTIIYPIK